MVIALSYYIKLLTQPFIVYQVICSLCGTEQEVSFESFDTILYNLHDIFESYLHGPVMLVYSIMLDDDDDDGVCVCVKNICV